MFFGSGAEDENVVHHEDQSRASVENGSHAFLEMFRSGRDFERQAFVAGTACRGDERSKQLRGSVERNLMKAAVGVELREVLGSVDVCEKVLDGRQQVAFSSDAQVQVGEVAAKPDASVGFRNDDHTSAPVGWLVDLADDVLVNHALQFGRDGIAKR